MSRSRLLSVAALLIAAVAPAAARADDAPLPTVAYVDGAIHVTGTAAAEVFIIDAGDASTVSITRAGGAFAAGEDDAGVCSTFNEHATCEIDYRPEAEVHGPADVVFDLGAGGADAVTSRGDAPGVGTVTASYASATGPLTYDGTATPATVTLGGDVTRLTGVARIVGTPLADTFKGGPAAETLLAGAGDDVIDVVSAGGPGDAVDCGAGKDSLSYRLLLDTQSGCEVLNGRDTTIALQPPPPPILPGPPPYFSSPPPVLPPPVVHAPPAGKVTGSTIDLTVTCAATGCPGSTLTLGPPAGVGSVLPPGWPSGAGAADLDALMALIVQQQVAELTRDLAAAQSEYLERLAELLRLGEKAQDDAKLRQSQAVAEMLMAAVQAALALAHPNPAQTVKLEHQLAKTPKLSTPLTGTVPTQQKGKQHGPAQGAAALAARARPTGRMLSRWLLVRTARALPKVRAKLTPTRTPHVYRARIKAPGWLRATGRVLRHAGRTTLPVDLQVGTTTAHVRLPLPR